MDLSVVIATHNEEKKIKKCLDSIKSLADEIVIVDGNSEDKTVEIAKRYGARVFQVPNRKIFHINKQIGLDKATKSWILQLDADEVVTAPLKKEIADTIRDKQEFNGYYIPRKNYFLGAFLRKGGIYPDYVVRLFLNGKGKFPCKDVHEQIEISGKVGYLHHPLEHFPYDSISDYLVKANRYTSLAADKLYLQKVKVNGWNTLWYCLFLPAKTFLSIFVRHLGFQDGIRGFIWAFLSASRYFLAYSKLINYKKTDEDSH